MTEAEPKPARFVPHRRLLDELVGSNLYPDPSVFLRELVQNAWDAIQLRRRLPDAPPGAISVTYSLLDRWIEVADNGIGMSERDIHESLLQVGRDKGEALGIEETADDQIAYFGIGFLSVFLVGDHVEIWTQRDPVPNGLHVLIDGLDSDVVIEAAQELSVGTRVRVYLRANAPFDPSFVPDLLRHHVRHVPDVSIVDADGATSDPLAESWDTTGLWGMSEFPASDLVRQGRLGFDEALRSDGVLSNRFTLSNAGFLVEGNAFDFLPLSATAGMRGELDLHPRALNIVMARERFQRDEAWANLGTLILDWYADRTARELNEGTLRPTGTIDSDEIRRCLLIWEGTLFEDAFQPLIRNVRDRIWERVLFPVAERDPNTLAGLTLRLPAQRIYFRRISDPTETSRSLDDDGTPIQFVEEVRYGIRVGALRARGFSVVEVGQLSLMQQGADGASRLVVDEEQTLRRMAEERGFDVRSINDALPEDMDLSAVEVLPGLHGLFTVGEGLRFARVGDSRRRVVKDLSGVRYLNIDHPVVRRVLLVLPDALNNPVKRKLLDAYLSAEDFEWGAVRGMLLDILETGDLSELASAEIAPLTAAYVRRTLEALMAPDG